MNNRLFHASALLGCIRITFAAIAAAALPGAIHAESAMPVAVMIAGGGMLAVGVRWGLARE